jgi:predicted small lipoprotein YifL
MKKVISAVLIIMLLLSFSACGGKDEIVVPEEEMIESESEIKTETEPEQTIDDENIHFEESSESFITFENGNLSGMIYPMINTEKGGEVCKEELVSVSMSVPEGWKPGTLEEKGDIFGITFKLPWDNYHYASLSVYKDTGKTYDEFLANHSLWVGINEHTYHEAEGNFLKGSYIHFNYPAFEKYDHEDDAVPVYGRFYQLQFDGYVADVDVYIRIDSDKNTNFDEKICDEFISSIKIG